MIMDELEIILREDTDEGALFYQPDPEVEEHLIYIRNPHFTVAEHRVELEDPVLFRLNINRILSAVKIVIPRHAWQIRPARPIPITSLKASLEFPLTTIQQHSFNLKADVITDADCTYTLLMFGKHETSPFWVALSSHCWALIAANRLKGFFILLR
ncbi:MAG: hypothetical protein GFH27_549297n113 [Chloroflexi bacterium AL-W]|nr:hypothetical protein [Chloroflexi bacterium AL-N1]NOK68637.1 hypothetical protein [Chloroflexi bacterium AL-N10]NOK76123.1 hypothetical protein [Chloroflexi bacterium AL-N5]NOK82596.1 hypothetical protein [Chloroflexi bacterium AL-W]NOK93394.1 hypothetical protein [Chloroflexi bacterium AL-N15]